MAVEVLLGTTFCLGAAFMDEPLAFFALLSVGCIFIFMTTSATNIATMSSVPPENRPFAIAVSTIGLHLLGDVPSPVVIGVLDDTYTPKIALVCTTLWLLWAVALWFAAWAVWKCHLRSSSSSSSSSSSAAPSSSWAVASK